MLIQLLCPASMWLCPLNVQGWNGHDDKNATRRVHGAEVYQKFTVMGSHHENFAIVVLAGRCPIVRVASNVNITILKSSSKNRKLLCT